MAGEKTRGMLSCESAKLSLTFPSSAMGYEALPRPRPGRLSDAVYRLAGDMLKEITGQNKKRLTIVQRLEMLRTCPPAAAAVEANVLLGLGEWGDYENENEELQTFIRSNLECMDGAFEVSLAEIYSVSSVGWVASEISHRLQGAEPAELWLEGIGALDPRHYSFKGRRSRIESISYRSQFGKDVDIDYRTKILHVVNKPYLSFGDPTGVADCEIAGAAWEAWKIIVNEALLAGQRQATPIIAATSPDETVPLVNADGTIMTNSAGEEMRVPATEAMDKSLRALSDNASYLSMIEGSEARALNTQTDGKFFMDLLNYFERLIFLSFFVSETIFSVGEGGLGNAGIAEVHMKIMMKRIRVVTKLVQKQLNEKVVRPLIEWNFGEQDQYGSFAAPPPEDGDRIALFNAINSALSAGNLSPLDQHVQERFRALGGIPGVAEIAGGLNVPPDFGGAG